MSEADADTAPRAWRAAHIWPWLRVGISLGLCSFLLASADSARILQTLAAIDVGWLAVLLVWVVLDRVYAAYRWWVLLPDGVRAAGLRLRDVVRITYVSGFLGYFMPGAVGVEVARIYGLARSGRDLALAVSSVAVDRVFGMAGLVVVVSVGFWISPPLLPESVLAAIGLVITCGVVATFALMSRALRDLALHVLDRSPAVIAVRARGSIEKLYTRLDDYRGRHGLLAWSLLLAIGFQVLRVLRIVVTGWAIGIDMAIGPFFLIVPTVFLLTLLPISVAGLGVREVGYVYLFGLFGMAAEDALLLSLLGFALGLAGTLPGAWLYAFGGFGRDRSTAVTR